MPGDLTAEFPKEPAPEPNRETAQEQAEPTKTFEEQVAEINAQRPTLECEPRLTPDDKTLVAEVDTIEMGKENARLDREVEAIMERHRLERERNLDDFDRVR